MNRDALIKKFTTPDEAGLTLMTPLTVCKERKILYFHIAKTGGSSIIKLLKNNGLDDGVLSNKHAPYDEKVAYFTEVAEEWDKYYKFTFVRNKFDLLISLYNYDRQLNGPWSLGGNISFEDFVTNHIGCDDTFVKKIQYNNLIDQHYLTHLDEELMFDFVGHYITYAEDLTKVCDTLGIVNTEIRVNSGNYNRDKKDDYYTNDLKNLVRTRFAAEMEHFGW